VSLVFVFDCIVPLFQKFSKYSRANNWTFDVGLTYPFEPYLDGFSVRNIGLNVRYLVVSLGFNSNNLLPLKDSTIPLKNMLHFLDEEVIENSNVLINLPLYGRIQTMNDSSYENCVENKAIQEHSLNRKKTFGDEDEKITFANVKIVTTNLL